MGRITKRDKEGVAFWNGTNGLSYSDNKGNIYGEAISKLADYEDLEEQGLLLRTPIAEQTEIWTKEPFKDGIIRKGSVEVLCFVDNRMFSFGCSFSGISLSAEFLAEDLGETVFFTREEAELKLKEMESGN